MLDVGIYTPYEAAATGEVSPGQTREPLEIEKIHFRHREILRRLCAGQKNVDIAREMNIGVQAVANVSSSPLAQQELERLNRLADLSAIDVKKKIHELTPKALLLLEEVLGGEVVVGGVKSPVKPSDRIKAAFDVLDRAGYGAVKQHVVSTNHLTQDEVDELKSRGRESGLIIEVPRSEELREAQRPTVPEPVPEPLSEA